MVRARGEADCFAPKPCPYCHGEASDTAFLLSAVKTAEIRVAQSGSTRFLEQSVLSTSYPVPSLYYLGYLVAREQGQVDRIAGTRTAPVYS